MPCEACGKECKCTPTKCSDGCKCPSPDKCSCNMKNKSDSSGGKKDRSSAGVDDHQGGSGKCCGRNK